MKELIHNSNEERIRWDVVCVIALISVVGVLGFKLLWLLESYRSLLRSWPVDVQYLIHPLMRMVLVLIGYSIVQRMVDTQHRGTMGLAIGWSGMLKGCAIGFLSTIPMLLLGILSDEYSPSRIEIVHGSLMPGVTEEIFFRAFMFGLLVQVGRCPMWPTAILTGVIFGLAHVDITPEEGETILGQLGFWIAMIGVGGFMYAWLYRESRWNLWLVIALHTGMNFWWGIFDLNSTPLGSWGATLVRVVSVGLAVLFVMHYKVLGSREGSTIECD